MGNSFRVFKLRLLSAIAALALLGCGLLPTGTNQAQQSGQTFSGDRAYTHVRYLSEEIGSRPAATTKAQQAADYIAEQLRLQRLDVVRPGFEYEVYTEKKVELEVTQPTLGRIRAASLMFSASGEQSTELVDAGEGRPEDFSGRDIKGKIALMRRGDIHSALR